MLTCLVGSLLELRFLIESDCHCLWHGLVCLLFIWNVFLVGALISWHGSSKRLWILSLHPITILLILGLEKVLGSSGKTVYLYLMKLTTWWEEILKFLTWRVHMWNCWDYRGLFLNVFISLFCWSTLDNRVFFANPTDQYLHSIAIYMIDTMQEGICADAASFDLSSGLLTACISEAKNCIDISSTRRGQSSDETLNPDNFAILRGRYLLAYIFYSCDTLLRATRAIWNQSTLFIMWVRQSTQFIWFCCSITFSIIWM